MGIAWTVSIYFVVWWTVLFAILPIGVRSHADLGTTPPPGSDPGAPVGPKLRRKFITTTWVSAILVGLLWLAFYLDLIHIPRLPGD